ncbi:unnamed protein product [Tetraodon nigroviridis]|uniref:(spotted green pufferfish) hypothetical protein n=1 Tax=Tetraodon nigroviridis TaxID=99883 RepID=Q4S624_TETNG|nr:unnamed protein product [Tetraodon nigroviridis]
MKLFFYNRFVEPIDRSGYRQQSSAGAEAMHQAAFAPPPAGATPLSFAEVMQLVQEGKEVPGVTKMDVQPTNQSPTPSRMERMRKPWEISAAPE